MVFAIILAVLVVIIGILALVIKLFRLEKQYLACQSAVIKWLKKVFSCICIFIRMIAIGIASFFMAIARFIKKIFAKKDKPEKEKKVKEKKSKESKVESVEPDKKSGRVVRQFSRTRPILLPPEEEKETEEEKTEENKENEIPAEQNQQNASQLDISQQEVDEDDDEIEDVDQLLPPQLGLRSTNFAQGALHNNSTSNMQNLDLHNDSLPASSTQSALPTPAEISRMRQEAIFREQQRAISSYENPNGRQFRLSTQSLDSAREAEERRRNLEATLQSLRASMERQNAERQSFQNANDVPQIRQQSPVSFQFRPAVATEPKEERRMPSLRDFMGKNSLTPRETKKVENANSTIDVDKIDLNKLPEDMRKQIIMEYLGNNPEKDD